MDTCTFASGSLQQVSSPLLSQHPYPSHSGVLSPPCLAPSCSPLTPLGLVFVFVFSLLGYSFIFVFPV